MLRIASAAAVLSLLVAGCGKKAPVKPPPSSTHAPVGPVATHTNPPPDDTHNTPPGPDGGGWVPTEVPESEKNQPYTTVMHLAKSKGVVFVINLDRYMVKRGEGSSTGSSITVENLIEPKTTWELVGGGLMEKINTAPDKTDLFFRLEGKRTMVRKFMAPSGMAGEKHDWTITVDKVDWEKNETVYSHEVAILESELWDDYMATVDGSLDLREALKRWKKHQATADELGLNLDDRTRSIGSPAGTGGKKPYDPLVTTLERLVGHDDVIQKKGGGVEETVAWLETVSEWSHFPPTPVSGDLDDNKREVQARQDLEARVENFEGKFKDRLKEASFKLDPVDASKVLQATDGTLIQKLMVYAGDAGRYELSVEAAVCVFGTKEKPEWKQTTLSLLKNAVSTKEDFFAAWPDADLAAFPNRLKEAVYSFTKGQLIPTRNAVAILERLKESKPGQKAAADAAIAELKKK